MSTEHYDVIIIGSGAGGGTLAYRLAPSGKRILMLERGGYLPREKENWNTDAVFVRRMLQNDGDVVRPGRPAVPPRHPLLCRRQHEVLRRGAAAVPRARLRRGAACRRHLAGVADVLRGLRAYYTEPSISTSVHGERGIDPTEPPCDEPYPHPAVSATSRASRNCSDDLRAPDIRPFSLPVGDSCSTSRTRRKSRASAVRPATAFPAW